MANKIRILFLLFLSCNHPEEKKFQRNQGYRNPQEIDLSSNIVKMELENGVRYIWVEINGIRLRFIFDTGASSICISPAEATVLYRQGTLKNEDFLDVEYFQDATGRISEGTIINLRQVKIGNFVLENVKATIIDNVNAPLLLGQTVLERFGKIEIDNIKGEIIFK